MGTCRHPARPTWASALGSWTTTLLARATVAVATCNATCERPPAAWTAAWTFSTICLREGRVRRCWETRSVGLPCRLDGGSIRWFRQGGESKPELVEAPKPSAGELGRSLRFAVLVFSEFETLHKPGHPGVTGDEVRVVSKDP